MNDPTYSPETLADRLDTLLGENPPTIVEHDPLIETALRLRNSTPPVMSPEAIARIEQGLLKAHTAGIQTPASTRVADLVWAVFVIILVATSVIIFWWASNSANDEMIPLTEAPVVIEFVEEADRNADLTTALDLPPAVVIEGLVEAMDDTSVTIFGVQFDIRHNPALLDRIRVGDNVRVEGAVLIDESNMTFVALDLILAEEAEIPLRLIQVSAPPTQENGSSSDSENSNAFNPPPAQNQEPGQNAVILPNPVGNPADQNALDTSDEDHDRGHGNDADGADVDNPGKGTDNPDED